MKKIFLSCFFWVGMTGFSQKIENSETLQPFWNSLKDKNNVTQILFLGDSHTQAGFITDYLREKFQSEYGNAGRGLVFPYPLANTNGANDFSASSNSVWEAFRLTHEQEIYLQIGAGGFIIGNKSQALIEIELKNDDFNQVTIFNDPKMQGKEVELLLSDDSSLKHFVEKQTERVSYQIQEGDTFPSLASMFNTTTTKLKKLNGTAVRQPQVGTWIKADKVTVDYDSSFENLLQSIDKQVFGEIYTYFQLPISTRKLLLKTYSDDNNFYGFHFANGKNGVIFNSVGVNGATYADFTKFPLQFQQLKTLNPQLLIVALGTNEGVSKITEEEFKESVENFITNWKLENKYSPILLITPTDNTINAQKTKKIADWIIEISQKHQIAYLDLYQAMGGAGYFRKALAKKVANKDGVHLFKAGYEEQAKVIWEAVEKSKK